jgi:hypothetical protein
LNDPFGPVRDFESYLEDCRESENCVRDSRGIKSKTLLSDLKYFKNPAWSTNIDYMHSVLEGVIKRFFKAWFEDTVEKTIDDEYNYSLKPYITLINNRLMKIKPPSYIPVCARSITEYHHWRANEFLTFFIYYMLPVFNGFMRQVFYVNITKLVVALEYLLNREIKVNYIDQVKDILKHFVKEAQAIYPENIMLSGMHELLHLADCTKIFGPMNVMSCFPFEEVNRKILRIISGKDLIGDEFLYNFSILQSLTNYCNLSKNSKLAEYINKYNIIKTTNKKIIHEKGIKLGPVSYLNKDQIKVLLRIASNLDIVNAQVCYRLRIDGVLYTSVLNQSKRGDFSITTGVNHGIIQFFLIKDNNISIIAKKLSSLATTFFVKENPLIKSALTLCNLSDEYFIASVVKIKKIFYIQISEDLNFYSTFSISHLFL